MKEIQTEKTRKLIDDQIYKKPILTNIQMNTKEAYNSISDIKFRFLCLCFYLVKLAIENLRATINSSDQENVLS